MSFEIPEAWKGLYPQVPKDLDREPFVNLIPICVFALSLALLVTVVISVKAKKKHGLFDKGLLFYFALSVLIHFNLERYYAHHLDDILKPGNRHPMARIWRYYGTSDTRWLGRQFDVPASQYSCMYGLEIMAAWGCGPTILAS
ncbi:MAG: hypothetical protein EZS28_051895, partial [Streblomastix strix]